MKRTGQDLDAFNRDLFSCIPETVLGREVLVKALTAEEERSNFVLEEVPQDVKHLLDCKTYQIPVILVVSRDYSLFPFNLPEDCGICVLGFYKIVEVEVSLLFITRCTRYLHESSEPSSFRARTMKSGQCA